MNKPKRHHYLPKFYLEGFCNEEGGLYIFDRKIKEIRCQKPLNTALQKDYYTFIDKDGEKNLKIEEMLSQIEGDTKPIIEKLNNKEKINNKEKEILSLFIGFLSTRTPSFQDMVDSSMKQLNEIIIDRTFPDKEKTIHQLEKIKTQKNENWDSEKLAEFIVSKRWNLEIKREASLDMMIKQAPKTAELFYDMNWIFIHAPAGSSFMTSDNPIILYEPNYWGKKSPYGYGIGTPGVGKLIPLSDKVALLLGDIGNVTLYVEKPSKVIRALNCDIFTKNVRFSISKSKEQIEKIVKIVGDIDTRPRVVVN